MSMKDRISLLAKVIGSDIKNLINTKANKTDLLDVQRITNHTKISESDSSKSGKETWVTIATLTGDSDSEQRAIGDFTITDETRGQHAVIRFIASSLFGKVDLTILASNVFDQREPDKVFEGIRIKYGGTYDGSVLQVKLGTQRSKIEHVMLSSNSLTPGWKLLQEPLLETDSRLTTEYQNNNIDITKLVKENYLKLDTKSYAMQLSKDIEVKGSRVATVNDIPSVTPGDSTAYTHLKHINGRAYLYKRSATSDGTLQPYNYWRTSSNNSYGEYMNWTQGVGSPSNEEPKVLSLSTRGYYVKAGTILKTLYMSGRLSNNKTDLKDMRYAIVYVKLLTDPRSDFVYNGSSIESITILRDNWINHQASGINIPDNKRTRIIHRRHNTDYTFENDGYLYFMFKPSEDSTNIKNSYWYGDVFYELEIPKW